MTFTHSLTPSPLRNDVNSTFYSGMKTEPNTSLAFSPHIVQVDKKEMLCDYFLVCKGLQGKCYDKILFVKPSPLWLLERALYLKKKILSVSPFKNLCGIYNAFNFSEHEVFFSWHLREAGNFRDDILTNSSIDRDKKQEALIKETWLEQRQIMM